ncbi:hypothetical protein EJD97_014149 [Solanum chilense]|uniref:Ubiquitin-like protease family profile domain-containing protein n=1 Tax=Solanum chilense TaxID=4083 RepID=A0A6N2B9N2_SOLCI|nr:hypothetical protein EJD97_014149 [Solanum chilense]
MWAENKSNRLYDPLVMKDKSVVKPKKKVGEIPKKGRRKVTYVISRLTLPKGMNYVIKKYIRTSIEDQITKCLLLLEVQKENKDVLHVRHGNEMYNQESLDTSFCNGKLRDHTGIRSDGNIILHQYFHVMPSCLPGHLLRRSSRMSGTSSPPPLKRRKKLDTHKTKRLESLSLEKLRPPLNQSFSMSNEEPTPPANVSFVHVSLQVQKYKFVYPDIEELRQHMKEYVIMLQTYFMKEMGAKSTPYMVEVFNKEGNDGHQTTNFDIEDQDKPSAQMPHHFFEGTMNEDASYNGLTDSQSLISDSQLPINISITTIVVRSDINTPRARIRMPSKNCKSPYLTLFGSSEKGKEVMNDVIRPKFSFEGYEITNRSPSYLIDEFIEWATTCLLKTHTKNAHISNIGLMMILVPKNTLIVQELYQYMRESHNSFNIEYAEGIMQQEVDSLDCGLYIATFAEFLSDQFIIPPDTDGHLANYLRNRYATLLWRYDSDKVMGGYTSENDYPQSLKVNSQNQLKMISLP